MSLWIGGAPLNLAGDVTGPSNANSVIQLSGNAGVVAMAASFLLWSQAIAAPTIQQTQLSADVAPQNLTIVPQAPAPGAAVNKVPGDVVIAVPSDVGATKRGGFRVTFAGNPAATLGTYNTGIGALWLGVSENAANYALLSDGNSVNLNAPGGGGSVSFTAGSGTSLATWAPSLLSTLTPIAFTARTSVASAGDLRGPKDWIGKCRNAANTADIIVFGADGTNNLQFGDTANASIVTLAGFNAQLLGSLCLYTSGTHQFRDATASTVLTLNANSAGASDFTWAAGVTPTITQAQSIAAAPVDFTIRAQSAKAGGGASGAGLNLEAGTPDGAGAQGVVRLRSNSTTYLSIGASGSNFGSTSVAIAAGTNTLTAAQYAFPLIRLTGALVGAAGTVVLPNQAGTWWFDYSQVTGANGINFKSGTTTSATITTPATTTAQIVMVSTFGGNTVVIK